MRILVVEDEHRITNAIKNGLTQERYAVDVAYDGTQGFDLAATEAYDVIILDLMLPGINGLTICKDLRKKHIHTPILILTARGQVENRVEGLNAGADDYLTKPFSFEELLARIRALSRRPTKTVENPLKVADLSLDTASFKVERSGKTIPMSNKEFSFLEYFMRHPGQVLTKEQLISHIWNYDADVLPNTVEVYIRNLRNKVDVPFKNKKPLIHTVRGFGYKMEK